MGSDLGGDRLCLETPTSLLIIYRGKEEALDSAIRGYGNAEQMAALQSLVDWATSEGLILKFDGFRFMSHQSDTVILEAI